MRCQVYSSVFTVSLVYFGTLSVLLWKEQNIQKRAYEVIFLWLRQQNVCTLLLMLFKLCLHEACMQGSIWLHIPQESPEVVSFSLQITKRENSYGYGYHLEKWCVRKQPAPSIVFFFSRLGLIEMFLNWLRGSGVRSNTGLAESLSSWYCFNSSYHHYLLQWSLICSNSICIHWDSVILLGVFLTKFLSEHCKEEEKHITLN